MGKSAEAFRTISEVAAELAVPKHVLRFWEGKFPQIRPMKRGGGRRYYRPQDVELLRGIRQLLHTDGYTIKGVQKILRERGIDEVKQQGLQSRLAGENGDPGEKHTASDGKGGAARARNSGQRSRFGAVSDATNSNEDGSARRPRKTSAGRGAPDKKAVDGHTGVARENGISNVERAVVVKATIAELENCRQLLGGAGKIQRASKAAGKRSAGSSKKRA